MAPQATKTKESTAAYEQASPTFLSRQPSTPKASSKAASAEWNALREHLETRLASLRSWRTAWWTQNWSNLSEFILPRRSIWLTQGGNPSPNNMGRGRPLNNSIVDPTGTFAARICAAGLMSGLASPSRPWFKVIPATRKAQIDAAALALDEEIEDRMYTVLAGSNFYNSFAQECEDLVVFGTAPTIIYEDATDLIRLYNPAIGEYYLSSGASMRVDGLHRLFVMTVAQIVEFFGLDACPAEIQKAWKQKGNALETERTIAHAIEPNFALDGNKGKVPGNFTWREVYWVWGAAGEKPLSIRGFEDRPFTAARWATQGNDAYGRSPGMDVLPDVMQLQEEARRKAEAIQKHVRPPLLASMELKNQPSSTLPGSVTYAQNIGRGAGMRSIYEVNPDINALMQDLQAVQARIKVGFFNDLFLQMENLAGQKMTATEISARINEKLQVIGPVIEGLLTESLKPKLKRIYAILKKKGMIDPPPDSLKGMPLDIQFVSILAVAQKAAATAGMERIAALVGNMAPVFPDVIDILDADAFVNEMNELLGNPEKILRGPEQIQAIRQQKQQQAQAASKMAAAQHMAQTGQIAAQAGQVLSQTEIGGGQTALGTILGVGK